MHVLFPYLLSPKNWKHISVVTVRYMPVLPGESGEIVEVVHRLQRGMVPSDGFPNRRCRRFQ